MSIMMEYTHDWIGTVHLSSAIIALVTGTMVLVMKKGTARHRKVGYIYAAFMILVVVTAFLIYRLFGGFGLFHIAAVASGITLISGMVPVIMRKPEGWVSIHFSFMYWSVMGLYAAFVSETLVRVPNTPFFGMVGLASGGVMLLGGCWFYYRKAHWKAQFTE